MTLANGELWEFSDGSVYDRTNAWAGPSSLAGGIQHFDVSGAGTGLWASDSNTLINLFGTASHTFSGTITGVASATTGTAYVTVSEVPLPPTIWLFGLGLTGLIMVSRRLQAKVLK